MENLGSFFINRQSWEIYATTLATYLEKTDAIIQNDDRLSFQLLAEERCCTYEKTPRLVWVSAVWNLKVLKRTNEIAANIQRRRASGFRSQ